MSDEPEIVLEPIDEEPVVLEPVLPKPPMQLRVHHLIVMTAVMAIFLAAGGSNDFMARFLSQFEIGWLKFPPMYDWLMTTSRIIYGILGAVGVTAVLFGIHWRRQGYAFFDEPGHWLLVVMATTQVVFLPFLFGLRLANTDFDLSQLEIPWTLIGLGVGSLLAWLCVAGFSFYIGAMKCEEPHWSVVFYIKAAGPFMPLASEFAATAMSLRAARIDNPRCYLLLPWKDRPSETLSEEILAKPVRRRDAVHWLGVGLQVILSVTFFAMLIMWQITFSQMMKNSPF